MTTKVTRNMLDTSIDDNGNATAITIDSSERVLIGTDSGDSFNSDSMLRLQRTGDRVFMQFKTDADQNSGILFGDVDDDVECAIEYEPANQALTLSTGNNAEAMRINSSGNVLLATTSAQESTTHLLTVGAYGRNGNGIYVGGYSANDMITLSTQYDQTYGMKYIRGSSVKGYVTITSVGAAHVNSGSDERLKENIQTWEEDVSSKFKNIKPKTFNFIDDENKKTVKGFIAQDMIDKFPEAYPYNEKQERYFYSAENMVVYLMKAIQEQQEQIESLQQEIEVLKNGN